MFKINNFVQTEGDYIGLKVEDNLEDQNIVLENVNDLFKNTIKSDGTIRICNTI